MADVLDGLYASNKELVRGAFAGAEFQKLFFADCKDAKLAEKVKAIIRG